MLIALLILTLTDDSNGVLSCGLYFLNDIVNFRLSNSTWQTELNLFLVFSYWKVPRLLLLLFILVFDG
jgi:hypothetical protein